MKVEVFGGITVKKFSPVLRGIEHTELLDQDILKVLDMKPLCMYGKGWTYAGTQSFNESNITITIKRDDMKDFHETFVGRTALRDFINFCGRNKITAEWHQKEMASA